MSQRERATELEWLRFFYHYSDFGPADSDVRDGLMDYFMEFTGKNLPDGWNLASDGETNLDKE